MKTITAKALNHLSNMIKIEFLEKELNKFNERINNPNTYEDLIGITNEEQQMEIATMFIEWLDENKIAL